MSKHICSFEEKKSTLCPSPLHTWCKKVLFAMFADLRFGKLSVYNRGKLYEFGEPLESSAIAAAVAIHDPRFYPNVLFKGSLGAAESYMKGYWSTDSLTDVFVKQERHSRCCITCSEPPGLKHDDLFVF